MGGNIVRTFRNPKRSLWSGDDSMQNDKMKDLIVILEKKKYEFYKDGLPTKWVGFSMKEKEWNKIKLELLKVL